MTSNAQPGNRILGTLRSADGKAVVRMQDHLNADVETVWSALTEPSRLACWYGEVAGDLRVGGQRQVRVFASGWEGTERIDACEPPRRLLTTGQDEGEPYESVTEITLAADGDQTVMVWEERGMPLEYLAGYGAGIQVHVEDLAAYLAGRGRCDARARMDELFPVYQDLAGSVG